MSILPIVRMRVGWRLLALAAAAGCAARIYARFLGLAGYLGVPQWLAVLGAVCFPLLVVVSLHEEAELRRRREEASSLRRRWDGVRQTSREVVWELTTAAVITYVNEATVELLGVAAAQLVGRPVFAVLHPEDVPRARALFEECAVKGTGWQQVHVRIVLPDGRTRWVETSGAPSFDAQHRLLGFTATTRRLDADDAEAAMRRVKRARVERVLRQRALHIVWQPIFTLADRRVTGAEALSRFDGEVVQGPDVWFADAHEVGLGVDLELLAVELALESVDALPGDLYVSVNASPATVMSGRLLPLLQRRTDLLARVVIELTEHALIEDYEIMQASLTELRANGVRIAVDDAGAGFASFRHVLQLQPDIVKLDRSITHGLASNAAQRALAAAVVMFALEVGGMTVTAEGVETPEDLSTAALLGIDTAQGYVLARPGPAGDVVSLLETPSTGRTVSTTVSLPTEVVTP